MIRYYKSVKESKKIALTFSVPKHIPPSPPPFWEEPQIISISKSFICVLIVYPFSPQTEGSSIVQTEEELETMT